MASHRVPRGDVRRPGPWDSDASFQRHLPGRQRGRLWFRCWRNMWRMSSVGINHSQERTWETGRKRGRHLAKLLWATGTHLVSTEVTLGPDFLLSPFCSFPYLKACANHMGLPYTGRTPLVMTLYKNVKEQSKAKVYTLSPSNFFLIERKWQNHFWTWRKE